MTRNVFKVTRSIEDSMGLVSATVQVAFIECIFQIDYGSTKLLRVGIQMVLVTSSIFAAVIEFAIKVSGKISAQSVKSPYRIAEIAIIIAPVSVVISAVAPPITISPVVPVTTVGLIWIICALSGCQYRQTKH
jgi:hypothetical protein